VVVVLAPCGVAVSIALKSMLIGIRSQEIISVCSIAYNIIGNPSSLAYTLFRSQQGSWFSSPEVVILLKGRD